MKNIKNQQKKFFKEILAEIESPQDIGKGSWDLPENPTLSQIVKYELCEKILGYQEDNNLSDKEIAERINLSLPKTEDILFTRIEKVNSDELINAVSKLFSPAEIKIIVEQKKR
jgi:predicted XRE-type DNA-binding protein